MWFKKTPAILMSPEDTLSLHLPVRRSDAFIRINISRNTLLAFLLSLLIHALFFFVVPKISLDNPTAPPPQTIEVSLAPPKTPKVTPPDVVPEVATQQPPPIIRKRQPKIQPKQPKIMTQQSTLKPEFSVPQPKISPEPPQKLEQPLPKDNMPTDMASYVRARQAQRQSLEADAAKQNADAASREAGPSEAEVRDARIKRNLQNGTNGIFEITSLSARRAGFSFRGWTNDYSSARRQAFEVEASSGQDIRLVMIKKMIVLIREHYQADFHWDSHRLGRVILLSAKPEDNAGLEDFMMMEFFGPNYKNQSF